MFIIDFSTFSFGIKLRIDYFAKYKLAQMGIIEQGINGPFKGKAGSVIGSSWKKINYIKGLRRDKGRKRPPTSEQAIQRQKFILLNGFLTPIKRVLNVGFGQFTAKATSINAAFQYNYDRAFLEADDGLALDYPALKLSRGSLVTAGAEQASWEGNEAIQVTWNPKTYGMGGEPDDVAYAIAYAVESGLFAANERHEVRQQGSAVIDFREPIDHETVHVWLFFIDNDQKRASNTVYIPMERNTP